MNTEELGRVSNEAMARINLAVQSLMPRSPRFRYYTREGSRDRYFYTVEKINHKGSPKYVAGIYRYISSKKQFKLVKQSGFAKKYKANEAALKYRDTEAKRVIDGLQRQ